ncbi:hypothetical protein ACAG39_03795 [Caldicellulosiruptoraceae bacterium PP1]
MINRGFRYQTGEIKDVAALMKSGQIPEIDIDIPDEVEEVIKDLKDFGLALKNDIKDTEAVNKEEHSDFMFRMTFINLENKKECYLDFYEAPKEEKEGYDEIFWG